MDPSDNFQSYQETGLGVKTLETLEEASHYNRWICSHINPYLGKNNLEIGAGLGTMSAIIAESRNIHLCDLSEYNRVQLRKRFANNTSVKGITKDVFQYQNDQSLDAIYSSNVLEHIADDLSLIKKSSFLLRPKGFFVAFVPAGKWLYSKLDIKVGHVRRYGLQDKKRIQNYILEEKLPLTIESFKFLNPIGALGWFVKMKLVGNTEINKKDALFFNKLLPYIKWLDYFSPILWGQSLLIVIRKW